MTTGTLLCFQHELPSAGDTGSDEARCMPRVAPSPKRPRCATRYDVVVVGGGPAGGMAALKLGEAGCRVLVLERRKLPRYKPCAGGVPANLFASLPKACAQAIECHVHRVRFVLGNEGEITYDLPDGSIAMVARQHFDYALLVAARATIHDGEWATALEQERHSVRVHSSTGQVYHADYVIGADGAFSLVARTAGLRPGCRVGPALEAEVPAPPDLMARYGGESRFLLGCIPKGYAWIFPKREHLSFGIGAYVGSGRQLRISLEQCAAELGLPLAGAPIRGHGLPVYHHGDTLQRGHILLAGDAAGLLDPLSGEGIRHALHSGRLAAAAIIRSDLTGYSNRVYQEIGNHLRAGAHLARFFYGHPRLCFRLGTRNATVVAGLMRMLAGEVTYGDLISRVPGYLWRRLFRR